MHFFVILLHQSNLELMYPYNRLSIYYKILITILLTITMPFVTLSQKSLPDDFCISRMESVLFENINLLRDDYGMSKLQLSASLSYVANLHVNDLLTNNPDTSVCNLSSWSNKGDWTPCCYTKYLHNPDCMWDKPKELTPYSFRGYELVTFFEEDFNVDSITNLWSDSKETLDMILMRGNYDNKKWICAGVGINENYVSIWFGQRKDRLTEPEVCDKGAIIDSPNSGIIVTNKSNTYYLIFGSYPSMHDAREDRKKFKIDFADCDILVKNNKYRIYLNKFNSLQEALFAKQQLPFAYREAWILKD
jgi:hypothetical protein